jgi:peptidoglycan/LPS O-acetylase OafA/YrhL
MSVSRDNNFDLIRLIAAFQVMIMHAIVHLKINGWGVSQLSGFFDFFPGVLMFFTISGFLILGSYDRNKNLKTYFYNRCLRIFPALWVCFIITLIILLGFKVIDLKNIFSGTIINWIIAQLTFFQFWTPDIFRKWGVGTPNGSLWTIPVELQFYIVLPLIVILSKRKYLTLIFLTLSIVSVILNANSTALWGSEETILHKLAGVSIIPYLYSFLIGCMLYHKWDTFRGYIENRGLIWMGIFFLVVFLCGKPSYFPKGVEILSNVVLSILTISLAFTFPKCSRILKYNDISYGMYIYHMLVINVVVTLGYTGKLTHMITTVILTIVLSLLSWTIIEKRALMLKFRKC